MDSEVIFDVTLERRIRELCAQAGAARDMDELEPVLTELREALREHFTQLKNMVADYPFSPAIISKGVPPLADPPVVPISEKRQKAS